MALHVTSYVIGKARSTLLEKKSIIPLVRRLQGSAATTLEAHMKRLVLLALVLMFAVACDMKSCQISAGIVPPNTAE